MCNIIIQTINGEMVVDLDMVWIRKQEKWNGITRPDTTYYCYIYGDAEACFHIPVSEYERLKRMMGSTP